MTEPVYFDIETQNLAAEVGGWRNIEALRLAVAVTYDDDHGYQTWWESNAGDLLEELHRAELIVGFNVNMFDYRVMSLYGDTFDFNAKTFDIFDEVFIQAHKRFSLAVLAQLNLGEAKALESGVQAIGLYRTGKLEELAAYCTKDVELTKRLYELWEAQGLLWLPGARYVVWPGLEHVGETMRQRMEEMEL